MAKFMLLINGDGQAWEHKPAEEGARIEEGHRAFVAAAGGAILDGGELEGASMATSLRSRPGMEPEVADGPFTQATEVVGGYYLIEASDSKRRSAWPPSCRNSNPHSARGSRSGDC